jgi:hypothetical protein
MSVAVVALRQNSVRTEKSTGPWRDDGPIKREIVRSETSKLSMRSSPWMRGAPHVGFSTTIGKINS